MVSPSELLYGIVVQRKLNTEIKQPKVWEDIF